MKLLIVDDNAAVRRLIRSIVLPLAGDICECTDGADALSAYLAQRPDVVLMDVRMNEVDGIQATKQITAADPKARVEAARVFMILIALRPIRRQARRPALHRERVLGESAGQRPTARWGGSFRCSQEKIMGRR